MLGVIADHGEFPIERIKIDREGEGRWVGSVGHDECLRLTDLREVLEDEDADEDNEVGAPGASVDRDSEENNEGTVGLRAGGNLERSHSAEEQKCEEEETEEEEEEKTGIALTVADDSGGDDSDEPKTKKKRGKKSKDELKGRKKQKGRNELTMDPSFFTGL